MYFKIPINPLFPKGASVIPLFGKEGSGEIYATDHNASIIILP
jgi:hypothetical protein